MGIFQLTPLEPENGLFMADVQRNWPSGQTDNGRRCEELVEMMSRGGWMENDGGKNPMHFKHIKEFYKFLLSVCKSLSCWDKNRHECFNYSGTGWKNAEGKKTQETQNFPPWFYFLAWKKVREMCGRTTIFLFFCVTGHLFSQIPRGRTLYLLNLKHLQYWKVSIPVQH